MKIDIFFMVTVDIDFHRQLGRYQDIVNAIVLSKKYSNGEVLRLVQCTRCDKCENVKKLVVKKLVISIMYPA